MSLEKIDDVVDESIPQEGDLLYGIEHIDLILSSGLRFVYDPENIIDEYHLVPQILDVINTQDTFIPGSAEQCKVIIKSPDLNATIEQLRSHCKHFEHRCISDERAELQFNSSEDADHCVNMEIENAELSRPRGYFLSSCHCGKKKDTDNIVVIGPINLDAKELENALNEIDDATMLEKCYDYVSDSYSNFFVFSFKNKSITKHFCKFLSSVSVDGWKLHVYAFYDHANVVDIHKMFPSKFIIGGHIVTAKTETKIVQVLNMFLPGTVCTRDSADQIKELIVDEIGQDGIVCIYIPLSIYTKDVSYCPCEGRVYIECTAIDLARDVYRKLGGLFFNGRVVITSFFPEFCYRARMFM